MQDSQDEASEGSGSLYNQAAQRDKSTSRWAGACYIRRRPYFKAASSEYEKPRLLDENWEKSNSNWW